MKTKKLQLFALGGNEIAPLGLVDAKTGKAINPDVPMQWHQVGKTCDLLAKIIARDPEQLYVVSHGNGPQVGEVLRRSELAAHELPTMPLDVCVADTQGFLGYFLSQMMNYLRVQGQSKKVVSEIVTQTVVHYDDPAFQNPEKFIGSAISKEVADQRVQDKGQTFKNFKKNEIGVDMWRQVVPSPRPFDVVELDMIKSILDAGHVPVSVGGGGIPVVAVRPEKTALGYEYTGRFGEKFLSPSSELKIYHGVEAVIDKDLATALLGTLLLERYKNEHPEMKLEGELFIFTNIDGAKVNFGKPDQKDLLKLTVAEAEALIKEGIFQGGSMRPKVEAAVAFVKQGGKSAYITRVDLYEKTLLGHSGTTIIP